MADEPTVSDAEVEPTEVVDPTTTEPEPVEDEWTPPTREEFEATQKALAERDKAIAERDERLRKAHAAANGHKKQLAELQKQHEDDDTKAKREATEAALAQVKPVAIRAEAKAQLLGVKAKPERLDALMQLLDMRQIDIDGETVTGLDGEVERLVAGFPEFFVTDEPVKEPEPKKPTPPKIDTTGRKPAPVDTPKSFGNVVADLVLGKKN